jgi:hypothetical protein
MADSAPHEPQCLAKATLSSTGHGPQNGQRERDLRGMIDDAQRVCRLTADRTYLFAALSAGQRFWLASAVFGACAFATGCHWLRPLGSINAPYP